MNHALSKISPETIGQKIFLIRGHRVMLDQDLAALYRVPTKVLIQAVKRNRKRFPPDFMFPLHPREITNLRSQFVTSSWGGRRYLPYAFTEQGVAMLSSVLRSERAIQVNIAIMRTFVRLRGQFSIYEKIVRHLRDLRRRVGQHDGEIRAIFEVIRQLKESPSEPEKPKRRIGFHAD